MLSFFEIDICDKLYFDPVFCVGSLILFFDFAYEVVFDPSKVFYLESFRDYIYFEWFPIWIDQVDIGDNGFDRVSTSGNFIVI